MSDKNEDKYFAYSKMLKVLCEPKRLQIIDLLSCRELCACEILEYFHISQPTLSNDMKKLEGEDLVKSRRDGKNTFYTLNKEVLKDLNYFISHISEASDDCICNIE